MSGLDSDIAHLFAGSMLLVSFLLLYQDRMFALLNFFALHACVLALSIVVMLPVTTTEGTFVREDLAFALSVVLLGLLMMITRRNAVSQVIGFMSLENGLILAATGARGMPLVVEISVAFSVLIAFLVIGMFLFRIRERFDTVDLQALDMSRGETGGGEAA